VAPLSPVNDIMDPAGVLIYLPASLGCFSVRKSGLTEISVTALRIAGVTVCKIAYSWYIKCKLFLQCELFCS
jgi:hypothetical protein